MLKECCACRLRGRTCDLVPVSRQRGGQPLHKSIEDTCIFPVIFTSMRKPDKFIDVRGLLSTTYCEESLNKLLCYP